MFLARHSFTTTFCQQSVNDVKWIHEHKFWRDIVIDMKFHRFYDAKKCKIMVLCKKKNNGDGKY